jgi:O-antigen ligase
MSFIHSFFTVARGETRLALARAPKFAWRLLGVAGWGFFAILAGIIVGYSAVALPPMGLLGIIAIFALVLLWVLPDGFTPPDKLIRQLLFVMACVDLALPSYYAIQIPGLPWISARRLISFILIALFLFAYSTSRESRKRIAAVVSHNRYIFICAGGLLLVILLSIFTSYNPAVSLTGLIEVILEWYIPFIAAIYVIRSDIDVGKLLILVCCCALIVSAMGVLEFIFYKRIYIILMPKFMVDNLAAANPIFASMLTSIQIRNEQYRAASLFTESLSFAEFEAMVAPLALTFLIHGRRLFDKVFGAVVAVACLAGIFVSGSRGGYLAFLIATATLVTLFVIRSRLFQPRSLAAPIFGVFGASGAVLIVGAIIFVGRIHKMVLGGGATAYSNDSRRIQWQMGWPKIMDNPVTGHGYDLAGDIVGYAPAPGLPPSVDSFLLALLTEAGVPSALFFFGMCFYSVWVGARQYLRDRTLGGALAGGLACSITGFTAYRFYLAQRENMTLLFILVGCTALLHYFYVRANEQQRRPSHEAL